MLRKRIRLWLAETHGSQFELLRHFLSEQLVNVVISSDQVRRFVITILAVVGCIGPIILRLYIPKYQYLQNLDSPDLYLAAVRADRLFFISLCMIAAGLMTIFQWQGLFPDRRDYLALKPLPIRLYQVFVAQFLSSFVVTVVVIVDLNLVTSVLFPLLTSGKWQSPSFGVRYVAAHATATFCAGLFVFLAFGCLRGAFMNILPRRTFEHLSIVIQAMLATALVTATPYVFDMPNWHRTIAARPRWMSLFPPVWFLGLYETLLGEQDRYWLRLRGTALIAIGAAVVFALAAYFQSYRRHASRILEQGLSIPIKPPAIANLAAALLGRFVTHYPTQAAFVFTLQTLRRSRHHKLVIGFCTAIVLVFAMQTVGPSVMTHLRFRGTWSVWELESTLSLPLLIGAVLISAFCYVFQLPSDAGAGWVFRMVESAARRELLSSVEYLLVLCGLVPSLLLSAPIEIFALGSTLAFAHTALATALLLLLIEARLYEWHKIPFTCSYAPGRRNSWQTLGTFLFLFGVLIPTITYFEARLLRPVALLTSTAALSTIYVLLRSARQTQWRMVPLLFDENDDPLIGAIDLNRE